MNQWLDNGEAQNNYQKDQSKKSLPQGVHNGAGIKRFSNWKTLLYE
jgi:hypothetical protein